MTTSSVWFIFFATVALAKGPESPNELAPIERVRMEQDYPLHFRLTPENIQPGERATLEIELEIPALEQTGWKEEEGPPPLQDDLLTQSPRFIVLNTTYQHKKNSLIWGYELTAHKEGKVSIPPVEIRAGNRTFSSEALELKIASKRLASDKDIRPEFEELTHTVRWLYWSLWLLLLPASYLIRKTLDRLIAKLKRLKPRLPRRPSPVAPGEDPGSWLKREMARIRAQLEREARPHIADDLTQTLGEYFTRLTQKPVRAWTTREFLKRFSDNPKAQGLKPALDTCDSIKFARRNNSLEERLISALDLSERILLNVVPR